MTSAELLFSCIRYTVCDKEIPTDLKAAFDDIVLKDLYALSIKHDLAHLVCYALQKNDLLSDDETGRLFKKQKSIAVYRYMQMNRACQEIFELFEVAEIAYLPLKGAIIRAFYPEEWMRISCDIDILINEEDLKKACFELINKLGYTQGRKNYHDIPLNSPNGVHLELHFHIKEATSTIDGVLGGVWDYVNPTAVGKCRYSMTNEFFLFHQLAHMSYHFVKGGCGIRPFLDCYLLMNKMDYDKVVLNDLFERGSIKQFADVVFDISKVWFEVQANATSDSDRQLLNYILYGGVYGNRENRTVSEQVRNGSVALNILKKIWLPYDLLKNEYRYLEGRKYLLPAYEVRRWGGIVFKDRRLKQSLKEINRNLLISEDYRNETKQMFLRLGLVRK